MVAARAAEEACPETSARRPGLGALALVAGYLTLVHMVDARAWGGYGREVAQAWAAYRWVWGPLDLFKLLFWTALPLALGWRWLEASWFDPRRATRKDLAALGGIALCGLAGVLLVTWVPELRAQYPSRAGWSAEARRLAVARDLLWVVCWLPGWELCYRYFWLRLVEARWPGRGWVLVPLLEAAHHLQKPPLEALGMFVFGAVLTRWALARGSWVLPALAHLMIELELILVVSLA